MTCTCHAPLVPVWRVLEESWVDVGGKRVLASRVELFGGYVCARCKAGVGRSGAEETPAPLPGSAVAPMPCETGAFWAR